VRAEHDGSWPTVRAVVGSTCKQPVAATECSACRVRASAHPGCALEVRFGVVKAESPSRKLQFKELDITAIMAQEIDCPQG